MLGCFAIMDSVLIIFAYLLTVGDASMSIGVPHGISPVAFTTTIVTYGWSPIEDKLFTPVSSKAIEKQTKILDKIYKVDSVVKASKQIADSTDTKALTDLISSNRISVTVERDFYSMLHSMEEIDGYYDEMYTYATIGVNPSTIEDFAKTVVSYHSSSVKRLTEKIHRLLVPRSKRSGLFAMLAGSNTILYEEIVYTLGQSPHQLFYNLYSRIALTQLKAHAIMQLSYQLRQVYERGMFGKEAELAKNTFRQRSTEAAREVVKVLEKLPRHYWRYDPKVYRKDVNYLEITRLGQGYIINEKILNNGGSCYADCGKYDEGTTKKYLNDVYFKRQRRCSGTMYDCRHLSSTGINVCPAYMSSGRRYNYVETHDEIMGPKTACPVFLNIVSSRWDSCPYCICLCDDAGPLSDRYFSLRQAVSDIRRNRVVTGVRFAKKNRIIHLQVQQGELLPNGAIDADTVEWVPVDEFKLSDRYVYHREDYFKLDWKNRAIDLHVLSGDDVEKNLGAVLLTGVRFKTVETNAPGSLNHLNLEIRVTRFHFQKGKLYPGPTSTWIDNMSTQFSATNTRTEIVLEDVDISTKAYRNVPVSEGNQYVKFTNTAFEKDVAQTTVPFIDCQDVVSSMPTPLIGAGLYFKERKGFGGFLGLKIVTYNFSKHLQ